MRETWVQSLGQEDPLEKEMATTPVLLPEKFHGLRSLVGYSPQGHKESDTTERIHFCSLHIVFNLVSACSVLVCRNENGFSTLNLYSETLVSSRFVLGLFFLFCLLIDSFRFLHRHPCCVQIESVLFPPFQSVCFFLLFFLFFSLSLNTVSRTFILF